MGESKFRRSWRLRWAIAKAFLGIAVEQLALRMGIIACASKLNYSQACEQAQLNATTTFIGNAGTLHIFSGTQPSGPAGADGTDVLGTPFTLGSPFAPGANASLPSYIDPTLPSNQNASASIQPTWWRIKTSGGTAVLDGSAGTPSGYDMIIGPTTSGQPVAIQSFRITSGNSGH